MPKQPNKAPVTLARMKMDSSRVHAYHSLEFGKTGYLSEWLPSWLAPYIWWDSNEEKMYYRASDGDEVVIPNGYYVVQMPSKWPLIISPSGFEADWFPLSPDDDGYDVLATDNAITRSSTLAERAPESKKNTIHSLESADKPDKNSALARGFEVLKRYGEEEAKDRASGQYDERDSYIAAQAAEAMNTKEASESLTRSMDESLRLSIWQGAAIRHSIKDMMEYIKAISRVPTHLQTLIEAPKNLTPTGLREVIEALNRAFPEPSPELSDKGAATPGWYAIESQMQRDDQMYEQGYTAGQKAARSMLVEQSYKDGFEEGYKKGHNDGQEVLSESVFEAIRFIRRDTTQSPESVSAGSSGESEVTPTVDESGSAGESGHGSDKTSGPSGVYKSRLI